MQIWKYIPEPVGADCHRAVFHSKVTDMFALLPLETLPGWPEAPEVSTSYLFMLIVGGPIILGLIVALLTFTPTFARRFRNQTAETGSEVALTQGTSSTDVHV